MKIAQGAEAILIKEDSKIIKKRIPKDYRIKQIDGNLRKQRTRRELKILKKLRQAKIPVPEAEAINDYELNMEFLEGPMLKEVLDKDVTLARKIGEVVAKMHDLMIAHQDLTTSNMILKDKKVYLIDFGLAFHTRRYEDFAVDIHLFKQALESKHHKVVEKAMKEFWKGYKPKDLEKIKERFEKVEQRGRNKVKGY